MILRLSAPNSRPDSIDSCSKEFVEKIELGIASMGETPINEMPSAVAFGLVEIPQFELELPIPALLGGAEQFVRHCTLLGRYDLAAYTEQTQSCLEHYRQRLFAWVRRCPTPEYSRRACDQLKLVALPMAA